jgi:hypothetical protein
VFVRAKKTYLEWLRTLAEQKTIKNLISAHYSAPQLLTSVEIETYADSLEATDWARSDGSWQLLAAIDRALLRLKIVPSQSESC